MTDRQRYYGILRRTFFPLLRSQGFEGTSTVFRRRNGEMIDVLDFQGSQKPWEFGTFCVNLGVHPKFLPTSENGRASAKTLETQYCEFWVRLAPEGETDHWWKYGKTERQAELSATHLIKTYETQGVRFFQHYASFPDPFLSITPKQLQKRDFTGLPGDKTQVRSAWVLAQINLHLGRPELARQFANLGLANVGNASTLKKRFEKILAATK